MYQLPALPYTHDALSPVISETTMQTHHGKHHAKYVENLNGLLAGKDQPALESVISESRGKAEQRKVFNNAAQIWNHTFFWVNMSPVQQAPAGDLAAAIERDFGGLAGLRAAFVDEGVAHFASGWVWLAARGEKLVVVSTHDAETLADDAELTPLMLCDLWEHAYYLDYRQDRKGFLEGWFDRLPNWEFAQAQYAAARGQAGRWRHP